MTLDPGFAQKYDDKRSSLLLNCTKKFCSIGPKTNKRYEVFSDDSTPKEGVGEIFKVTPKKWRPLSPPFSST